MDPEPTSELDAGPPRWGSVLVLGAIQFVVALSGLIVLPLGPDLARDVALSLPRIAWLSSAYAAAAALTGLAGALWLDRLDRRLALTAAVFGQALSMLLTVASHSPAGLLIARFLAGAFGGPALVLISSLLADSVPVGRRGRAVAAVLGALALANALGVPACVALAEREGWRAACSALAVLGGFASVLTRALPASRGASSRSGSRSPGPARDDDAGVSRGLWRRSAVVYGFAAIALTVGGTSLFQAHLSAFVQFNLALPRTELSRLYLIAGVFSFLVMRAAGVLVDRAGSLRVGAFGTVGFVALLAAGAALEARQLPPVLFFATFMAMTGVRLVAINALLSKVPRPRERARFASLQATIAQLADAAAAYASTLFLEERPDRRLDGVPAVALAGGILAALALTCLVRVERRLVPS